MNPLIRPETEADFPAIADLVTAAFGQPDEAYLIARLRADEDLTLGLVAEIGGEVVGHITFSPMIIEGEEKFEALALAPMAVAPAHQKSGIGSALIREGLKLMGEMGHGRIIVLGHADYYPKFGFAQCDQWGITAPFDYPPEALMAQALTPGALDHCAGVCTWAKAFRV